MKGRISHTFNLFILVIFISVTYFLLSINVAVAQSQQAKKPNIVLIFMDDMGYGDVDSYGGIDYETPNIDGLAANGMRFTNFYAAQPICTASRAALLTGCYPNRIGISGVLFPQSKTGLYQDEPRQQENCPGLF